MRQTVVELRRKFVFHSFHWIHSVDASGCPGLPQFAEFPICPGRWLFPRKAQKVQLLVPGISNIRDGTEVILVIASNLKDSPHSSSFLHLSVLFLEQCNIFFFENYWTILSKLPVVSSPILLTCGSSSVGRLPTYNLLVTWVSDLECGGINPIFGENNSFATVLMT